MKSSLSHDPHSKGSFPFGLHPASKFAEYPTSVTIPNTVTNIGDGALADCFSLETITVDVHNLMFSSVDDILFNKSTSTLIQCPAGRLGDYTIPEAVESIGSRCVS